MIPSSPHLGSAIRRHRLAIRRSAAVLAAALVIGAAPLVARALDDESVPTAGVVDSPSASPEARPVGNPTVQSLIGPQVPTVPDLGADLLLERPTETPPEVITASLFPAARTKISRIAAASSRTTPMSTMS